jgi:hypothetical protein
MNFWYKTPGIVLGLSSEVGSFQMAYRVIPIDVLDSEIVGALVVNNGFSESG